MPADLAMFISMFERGDILDGLSERQRRAVTHESGPLLVLAGAGTGKTRTLVARAAWLRDSQGLPSNRILLLTFTRRAASDMLARAASAGKGSVAGPERIYGGTFHAIAHKIIRQHAESFSLPPSSPSWTRPTPPRSWTCCARRPAWPIPASGHPGPRHARTSIPGA